MCFTGYRHRHPHSSQYHKNREEASTRMIVPSHPKCIVCWDLMVENELKMAAIMKNLWSSLHNHKITAWCKFQPNRTNTT